VHDNKEENEIKKKKRLELTFENGRFRGRIIQGALCGQTERSLGQLVLKSLPCMAYKDIFNH
jgi:hypothetical protein